MAKVNVLCLHGCCQDTKMFQSILKTLIKKGKNTVNFHFLQAPYEHSDGGYTWTNPPLVVEDIWRDKDSSSRENPLVAVPSVIYDDTILEYTFSIINEYIQKNNIKVLLGFSQGSFVIYEYIRKFRDANITRIVTMSGYTFNKDIDPPLDLDILNVTHPMDSVVPATLAYKNVDRTTLLSHNNKELTSPSKEGHKCPSKAEHINMILKFIQES